MFWWDDSLELFKRFCASTRPLMLSLRGCGNSFQLEVRLCHNSERSHISTVNVAVTSTCDSTKHCVD